MSSEWANARAESLNDLKYCYAYMPMAKKHASENTVSKLLEDIQPELQEKLRIGNAKLYFFRKV